MSDHRLKQRNSFNLFLNEHFSWLLFVGMLLVFVIAYFFFIGPKLQTTKVIIKDNIEAQERLYLEQEKKLRDLKTIQEVYSEILPADLARFDGVLPDKYLKETLFGEIEEIIIDRGFLLKSIVLTADVGMINSNDTGMPEMGGSLETGRVGTVGADIAIGAIDYAGYKQLLTSLEANARLFDIKYVNFSESAETAEFQIVTYYFKSL